MAVQDPRTARDYLNNARTRYQSTSTGMRWASILALLAIVLLVFFGWGASVQNDDTPVQTNSEPSKNPSPAPK